MSLFTSSPTVRGKDGAPNWAILPFASPKEKTRFLDAFDGKSILHPFLITMAERRLFCDKARERTNKSGNTQYPYSNDGSPQYGYNGGYTQYPYSNGGAPQYGYNDASRSYQDYYLHPYYYQTGYTTTDYYPNHLPPLGATSPTGTTARPPTWANCRSMDLPRLPAVSPRTRLWAPGWTRGI